MSGHPEAPLRFSQGNFNEVVDEFGVISSPATVVSTHLTSRELLPVLILVFSAPLSGPDCCGSHAIDVVPPEHHP